MAEFDREKLALPLITGASYPGGTRRAGVSPDFVTAISLDLDGASGGDDSFDWNEVAERCEATGYNLLLHETWTSGGGRARIWAPLARRILPAMVGPAVRLLIDELELNDARFGVDPCSSVAKQGMFAPRRPPVKSRDWESFSGAYYDPKAIVEFYGGDDDGATQTGSTRSLDAFSRAYPPELVMNGVLSPLYERGPGHGRPRWRPSGSKSEGSGVFLHQDGGAVISYHTSSCLIGTLGNLSSGGTRWLDSNGLMAAALTHRAEPLGLVVEDVDAIMRWLNEGEAVLDTLGFEVLPPETEEEPKEQKESQDLKVVVGGPRALQEFGAMITFPETDFRHGLRTMKAGKGQRIIASTDNAAAVLERVMPILGLDQMSGKVTVDDGGHRTPVDDDFESCVAMWLNHVVFNPSGQRPQGELADAKVSAAIRMAAASGSYHPLLDMLAADRQAFLGLDEEQRGEWTERVETWPIHWLNAEPSDYTRAVGKLTLLSAIARAKDPGCQCDTMLVLTGAQGTGKSTWLRTLGGEFYGELPRDLDNHGEVILATASKWITESNELSSFNRTSLEGLKAFLSRRTDEGRVVYARNPTIRPRAFIAIGTTNTDDFLADHTGGRRFAVLPVPGWKDKEGLTIPPPEGWMTPQQASLLRGAATVLHDTLKEEGKLDLTLPAEVRGEAVRAAENATVDPDFIHMTVHLQRWLDREEPGRNQDGARGQLRPPSEDGDDDTVFSHQIMEECFGRPADATTAGGYGRRISRAMSAIGGWKKGRKRVDGKDGGRPSCWVREGGGCPF